MAGLAGWRQGSDFVGKLWPNGEFGLGFQRRVDCSAKVERLPEPVVDVKSEHWKAFACRMALYQRQCDESGQSIPALGLSPRAKSHKRAKRGEKGITSHGRKMVRNGSYILQRKYGKRQLSFLTVTLPDVSREESIEISKQWGEVVRKYLQSLGRLLERRGIKPEIVACTEVQEERTARDGILGLHLHIVFRGRTHRSGWKIHYLEARKLWRRELERIVARPLDCSACENMEPVKHDAEQYLGKYLSKGLKSISSLIDMGFSGTLPAAWYSISASLRKQVKGAIEHLSGERAQLFVSLVEADMPFFLYKKPVEVTLADGQTIRVGYFGKILREFIHALHA